MTQSLILVAGLPSGGTSTVAGILHHLGVDMGSLTLTASGRRNYLGFECETAKRDIGGLPADASPEQIESAFRQYLDKRLATATGPCGVKLNLLALLGRCDGIENLPVRVVHVKRDLEATFASDIRYTGEDYDRAAWRGVYDLGLRQLVRRIPPVCTVQYEDAIAYPAVTVRSLARALGLFPTQAQIDKAIEFINPKACKVQPTLKLAVTTPWSSPFMWRKTAVNITNMIANFQRDGWQTRFFTGDGVDPAARHCDMILQGLDWGADLICIVGADQIHPEDMLGRLVDRYEETGGGVITALVPFRGYVAWQQMRPFQPMGWRIINNAPTVREFRGMDEDPDMFQPIDLADGDLQRVDVIGSGVMLFDRDTIEALAKPWFYYAVDEDMRRVADMDSKFVWRLRSEVQAQVWVDTTIKVKHLHTFEIDDSFSDRFADWQQPGAGRDDTFKYRLPVSTVADTGATHYDCRNRDDQR